jgi:hypothetical protein
MPRPYRRLAVRVLLLLLPALLPSFSPAPLEAQVPAALAPSDTLWQIRLVDGSTLFGRVTAVGPERISVVTAAGVSIEIDRVQIRSINAATGEVRDGQLWPADPNVTRLFFGPTGRMLEAGEGYFGAFELFFPFLAYGVTDWFTIAGGTPVIPEVIGRVIYLAPKVSLLQREGTALSAGVLAFFSTQDDFDSAGIGYVVGTAGSADQALTLGAGLPFAGSDLARRPAVLAGLESRFSPRFKLISENYLIAFEEDDWQRQGTRTEYVGILTAGVRFIGERLSADAGLGFGFGDGESFCCLPLVNFVYNFR